MLLNRKWVDPLAEAEYWKQLERLETATARLSSLSSLGGLLKGGPFRRAALRRDIEAIHAIAQNLVDRHTVLAELTPASATEDRAASALTPTGDPLRTLAGIVVSLRQDRAVWQEAGDEKAI